jgi:hypothetical protein
MDYSGAATPFGLISGAEYRNFLEISERDQRVNLEAAKRVANEIIMQLEGEEISFDFSQLRSVIAHTADIEDSVEKISDLIQYWNRRGGKVIQCIEIDNALIPTSFNEALSHHYARTNTAAIFVVGINSALHGIREQLIKFLTVRIATEYIAKQRFSGGMNNTPNFLSIMVSSQAVGARVSYSPSYFINYLPLAAPTSPVQGIVPPGRYIFRLTKPGPQHLVDQQVFDIPPSFNISLMV